MESLLAGATVHTSIHKVYKKNRQSQAIIFNDSTISSCLQGKPKPTGPFQPKIAQTLKILLIKPTFLPPKHPANTNQTTPPRGLDHLQPPPAQTLYVGCSPL